MKKYAVSLLVGLAAISLATAVFADSGHENESENGNPQQKQTKTVKPMTAYVTCRNNARTAQSAATKSARTALTAARTSAKTARDAAITAANGDKTAIKTAKQTYKTALKTAQTVYNSAVKAARTAYNAALVVCKAQNPKTTAVTSTPSPTASVSPTATPSPTPTPSGISMATVATHNNVSSCWTAINGNVYNLTSFVNQHPGGPGAILSLCGHDGSSAFNGKHGGQARPANELAGLLIGALR